MSQQESLIKLKALQRRLKDQLSNERARFFASPVALEFFQMYSPLRDSLRELFPTLLNDFPVRETPSPIESTDFGGAGYLTRWQLEPLLLDMQHLIELVDSATGSKETPANGSANLSSTLPPSISSLDLPPADKVSARWLWDNVPIHFWLTYLTLLISAFVIGVQASRLNWVREIFGLRP